MTYRCFHCGEKIKTDVSVLCKKCGYSICNSSKHYFLFDVDKETHFNLKRPVEQPNKKSNDAVVKNVSYASNIPSEQPKPKVPTVQEKKTITMDDAYKIVVYYFSTSNYEQMYAWAKELADMGHAGAAYYLGYMYELGLFVCQNYSRALYWYSKAHTLGGTIPKDKMGKIRKMMTKEDIQNIPSEQNVVRITPNNVDAIISKAPATPRKNISKASPVPQIKTEYLKGIECFGKGDYATMYKHMKNAADANYPDAIYYMGYMYEMGYYVTKDYSKAEAWYLKAAKYLPYAKKKAISMKQKHR